MKRIILFPPDKIYLLLKISIYCDIITIDQINNDNEILFVIKISHENDVIRVMISYTLFFF
jgi:hypothetical protein